MRLALIAFLLLAEGASGQRSQPPPPGGGNTERQTEQTRQTASQPAQPSQNQIPVSVNVSVNPEFKAPEPQTNQGADYWGTVADWGMVGITLLGTGLAVVGARIAWQQFKTQRDQTIEALEYAKDGVAVSRTANEHALAEAKRAEDRARTEMILAHPPRLAIRNVSIPGISPLARGKRTKLGDLTDELTGEYLIANVGRNEAIVEAVYSQWIVGELPMTNPCQEATGRTINLRIPAGMNHTVEAEPGKINWGVRDSAGGVLTFDEENDDMIAILDREKPVYLIGFVAYRDTLGGFRRTMFCRSFDYDTGRFKPVIDPDYNYKD